MFQHNDVTFQIAVNEGDIALAQSRAGLPSHGRDTVVHVLARGKNGRIIGSASLDLTPATEGVGRAEDRTAHIYHWRIDAAPVRPAAGAGSSLDDNEDLPTTARLGILHALLQASETLSVSAWILPDDPALLEIARRNGFETRPLDSPGFRGAIYVSWDAPEARTSSIGERWRRLWSADGPPPSDRRDLDIPWLRQDPRQDLNVSFLII
jgi:hypothetical protein